MDRKSRAYSLVKPSSTVEWTLSGADRAGLRRAVAEKWAEESPYTKYRYNVERCENGARVYLLRPTYLNKGFDFQVNLEGFRSVLRTVKGATKEMPAHPDVLHDLRTKIQASPAATDTLFAAVCDVYDCAEPRDIMNRRPDVAAFTAGWPLDQLLYIIKWLFIEQDLTYWLQTGRDMLMTAIERDAFGLSV